MPVFVLAELPVHRELSLYTRRSNIRTYELTRCHGHGVQLDMFKVIESWRVMPKDVFTATLHVLLYTKQIGSEGAGRVRAHDQLLVQRLLCGQG